MGPALRRAMLIVHLVASVGWIGAIVAYVVLDLAASTSDDPQTLRAAYAGMYMVAMRAIVPLAFSTLGSGLVMSLGTKWGLFRHYWVIISLVLTIFAILALLSETRTIAHFARVAADPATSDETLLGLGGTLVHSIGGIIVLLVVMVLNVFKPRGVTRHGWRKQQEETQDGASIADPGVR